MEVHIYDKELNRVGSCVVESIEEFLKSPEMYFESWEDSMLIGEMDYIHPKIEDGVVVSMSREEAILELKHYKYMMEGEIVDGGKIVKVNPSKEFIKPKWIYEGSSGRWIETVSLDELSDMKISLIREYSQIKRDIQDLEDFGGSSNEIEKLKEKQSDIKIKIDNITQKINEE